MSKLSLCALTGMNLSDYCFWKKLVFARNTALLLPTEMFFGVFFLLGFKLGDLTLVFLVRVRCKGGPDSK